MALHAAPARSETPVSPLVSPLIDGFPTVPSNNAQQQRLSGRTEPAFAMGPLMHGAPSPTNMSRTTSLSSTSNTSAFTTQLPSGPAHVHPPPAYVAPFGASQVVTERKRRFSDDEDDDVRAPVSLREEMQFSLAALSLLNAFLDQLLHSILSHAKSTTLTALRPAVSEVLKSKLAAEAIASAEEELQELLAGGDDEEEEMNLRQTVAERSRTWDTELVWKRTRLRVMVYIRLGDMEDDDEERYVQEDELLHGSDRRFSRSTGLVSWAAAIFLTSVVEYVAEQVLQAAAQVADSRTRRQTRISRSSVSVSGRVTPVDGVTVEDYDMERVALNSSLGRLWRTWRKSLRGTVAGAPPTPATSSSNNNFSRRFSRDMFATSASPTPSSLDPDSAAAMEDPRLLSEGARGSDTPENNANEVPEAQYPEYVLAANIPLPLADAARDVEEIETPGLARDPDVLDPEALYDLATNTPLPIIDLQRDVEEIETPGLAKDPDELGPEAMHELARDTPLPMADLKRDVDEIEVPGLAKDPDEPDTVDATLAKSQLRRRRSLTGSAPLHFARALSWVEDSGQAASETIRPVGGTVRSVAIRPRSKSHSVASWSSILPLFENTQEEDELGRPAEFKPAESHAQIPSSQETIIQQPENSEIDNKVPQNELQTAVSTVEDRSKAFDRAAAGSAAAAAAAVTMVYGSKFSKVDATSSTPAKASAEEVDERDNQKSLVDMKRISPPAVVQESVTTAEEGQSQQHTRLPVVRTQTPPVVAPTRLTSESTESFTLVDKDEAQAEKPLAKPRHLSEEFGDSSDGFDNAADIGVAKTSDTAVPQVDEPTDWRYARDSFTNPAPRRQSRLILGTSSPEAPLSPEMRDVTTAVVAEEVSPRSFLEKRALSTKSPLLDLTKQSSTSAHEQARSPAPKLLNRASVPDALVLGGSGTTIPQASPYPEKTPSPWRQSFSAVTESLTSLSKKAPTPLEVAAPVQEHPVVQKIANMKNADNSKLKEDEKAPLVSASIKGPEDFEMFVQGDDMVKYTLTPENVRDGGVVSEAPVMWQNIPAYLRQSPIEAPTQTKVTNIQVERAVSPVKQPSPPPSSRVGRSQSMKYATSATPIPPEPNDVGTRTSNSTDKRRSVSRPRVRNTSVHRRSGLIAREPQVVTESTRDFADFIRSTGPTKEPELTLLASRSTASLHSILQDGRRTSRSMSPGGRSLNRIRLSTDKVPPVPQLPGKGKSQMQPRGAAISSRNSGTSELIDFIRTGPNNASSAGQAREHRISRTVAPFRTTMDSDQMEEWGYEIPAHPKLMIDTKVDNVPSLKSASSLKTNRTSANSRSGLLTQSNVHDSVHPAHSGQPQRLSGKPLSAPPAEPKRYRGKDPYSIDFLDDEDDDLLTALPLNRQGEESLADFLRNSEPPASGVAAVSAGGKVSTTAKDGPQPKAVANMAAPRVQGGGTSISYGSSTKSAPKLEARPPTSKGRASTDELADFLHTSGPSPKPSPTTKGIAALRQESKMPMGSSMRSKRSISNRISSFFSGGIFGRRSAPKATLPHHL